MAVAYVPYGTVRVSRRWRTVLREADHAKVAFHVTSGHRTMGEQQALYNQNMSGGRPRPGRPLTAVPNRNAPHIRLGRADHAVDVDALDGGARRLAAWLRKQGAHPTFPVPGEAWHIELPAHELKALADRFAKRQRLRKRRALERKVLGVSLAGARFVAEFEGFRADPYKPDPKERYLTIGYGHYGPDVKTGMKWSKARALAVLVQDLRQASQAVEKAFPLLNQNQHDAITSAVFNMGPGVLDKGRSLGDALRAGKGVGAALKLYTHGAGGKELPGLVRRRSAEADLYNRKEK